MKTVEEIRQMSTRTPTQNMNIQYADQPSSDPLCLKDGGDYRRLRIVALALLILTPLLVGLLQLLPPEFHPLPSSQAGFPVGAMIAVVMLGGLAFQAADGERSSREAEFLDMIYGSDNAFVIVDDHLVIHSYNPAAQQLFGFNEEEIAGVNLSLLVPVPENMNYDEYLHHYSDHGPGSLRHDSQMQRKLELDLEGQRKGGRNFPLEITLSKTRLGGKQRTVCAIRDLGHDSRELPAVAHINRIDTAESEQAFLNRMCAELERTNKALLELGIIRYEDKQTTTRQSAEPQPAQRTDLI